DGEEVETRHHSPKPLEAKLALTVEGAAKTIRASNLVGVLPASPGAAPTEEIIVLGAHLDHVGMGGAISMSKEDAMHPGADDNASGVAGVLEVAEALAATPGRTRDVYVVAFDAEEPGLYGSSALVEVLAREGTPTPVFMLNMDMLGRPERAEVRVDGVYSGHGLAESVRRAQTGLVVHPLLVRGAPVGSDHLSFLQQKIPVLSLHTGQHDDYHTPRDTADQIDIAGLKQVVTLGFRLARDVVRRQRRVVWR
ncbi:MAG: M20/M25/M40 family metallo-hydrolase, partial [Myxococcota bacterium]